MSKEESVHVFLHLLYEYKKGLRDLALYTFSNSLKKFIEMKLNKLEIPYIMQSLDNAKSNVFFGAEACIRVVASFGDKRLNAYTAEEDFILGIMLGYNRTEQCKRYLSVKKTKPTTLYAFSKNSLN